MSGGGQAASVAARKHRLKSSRLRVLQPRYGMWLPWLAFAQMPRTVLGSRGMPLRESSANAGAMKVCKPMTAMIAKDNVFTIVSLTVTHSGAGKIYYIS